MKKITITFFFLAFFLFISESNAACASWASKISSFSTGDTCKTGYASININNVSCHYIKWTVNGTLRYQGQGNSGYNYVSFPITQNGTYTVCVKVSDTCNKCDTTLCSTITISCFNTCNWKSRLSYVHMGDTCRGNNKKNTVNGDIYFATGVNTSCFRIQWIVNNVVQGTGVKFSYNITQNGTYTQCLKITDTCKKCDTTICRTVTFSCFNNCNWKGQKPYLFTKDSCAGTTYYIMADISFNGGFPSSYKSSWTLNGNPVSYNGFLPISSNGTYTVCVKVTDTIKKCDTTFCSQVIVDCIKTCNWKSRTPYFFAYDSCTSSVYKIMAGISFNGSYSGKYRFNWTLNGSPVGNTGPVQQLTVTQNGTYTLCAKVTDTINKCDTIFCRQVVVDCIKNCNWKSRSPYYYFQDTCNGNGKRNKFHGYLQFGSGGCYKYQWTVNGIPVNPTPGNPKWMVYDVTKNGTYTMCVKVTDTCSKCDTTFCSTKTFSCFSNCNWKGRISYAYMSDTCRGYNSKNNIHGYIGFKSGVNTSCFKYLWTINNIVVSKKDRMDYSVSQNGNYTQCLKITDTCNNCDTTICRTISFGCINPPCNWKNLKPSLSAYDTCYIYGNKIITSLSFNGIYQGKYKFKWTLNGNIVGNNSSSQLLIVSQNGTYTVCVKVTDTLAKCDTTFCRQVVVNCIQSPCKWKARSPHFQVWDTCQSNSTRNSINGYMYFDTGGCYRYQWTVNGNIISFSNSLKYKLTANGTFNVCVKVTDTCNKCDTTFCSIRTITCFNGCNFKGGSPYFTTYDTCSGNKSTIGGAISFNNKPCLRYLWTIAGVGVSTGPSFASNVYNNGNYKICVKVTDTCNKCDTTFCITRTINCNGLGILKNTGMTGNIKVYPNPVDRLLNIDWGGIAGQFEVVDITGNLVYNGILDSGRNEVQTDTWANGLYLLRVNSGSGIQILKIVVDR